MPVVLGLGLYYACIFIGSGASTPFMPVWFHAQGLNGGEIGLILSTPMLARALAGPALALWADGFRLRRTPLIWMAGGATAALAGLGLAHGFWFWLPLWFVGSTLLATLSPLTDVLALRRASRDGFPYGWPRGMGSAGYVLANVVMGLVLTRVSAQAVLVWAVASAAAAMVGAWLLLPDDPVHDGDGALSARDLRAGLGDLLRRPTFLLAVLSISLIQASHGFFYGFSALVWRRQGVSQSTIGLLWAFGVVVEIVFMATMESWRRRMGPQKLLIIGGAAAMVRWSALAFSPGLPAAFALQALHALSFTTTFLASLSLIEQLSPPRSASAAQTLSASVSVGMFTGLATIVSGPLFDAFGAWGYLAMTLSAGGGVICALVLARRMRSEKVGTPA